MWVPFKLMFPEDDDDDALDIPIVEVSTYRNDDYQAHIELRKVLLPC